jgi:putative phosphoesterase
VPASIAVLADVHGNLPALQAVIAEVEREGFDVVVSAGDQVSGPMPSECLEALRALPGDVRWVMGNADRHAIDPEHEPYFMDGWAYERLSAEQRDFIRGWELSVTVGDVLVCHGTPRDDEEKVTKLTPPERLASILEGVDAPLIVCGHVHHQFALQDRFFCAGSIGMAYEDGTPGARWLAVRDGRVEMRTTPYDVDAAEAAVHATGYSEASDYVEIMRGSITADEAARAFEP